MQLKYVKCREVGAYLYKKVDSDVSGALLTQASSKLVSLCKPLVGALSCLTQDLFIKHTHPIENGLYTERLKL